MADYYSQNDRTGRRTPTYDTGSGMSGWVWAGIALALLLGLFMLVGSGGGSVDGVPASSPPLDAPAAETAPVAPETSVAPATD